MKDHDTELVEDEDHLIIYRMSTVKTFLTCPFSFVLFYYSICTVCKIVVKQLVSYQQLTRI